MQRVHKIVRGAQKGHPETVKEIFFYPSDAYSQRFLGYLPASINAFSFDTTAGLSSL